MESGCAAELCPQQAPSALGAPPSAGSCLVLRYHPAWQGSGEEKQAVGAPSTHRAPQAVMLWLCPTYFLLPAANCIPPCQLPNHCPGLPQTAAILPHSWGIRGCICHPSLSQASQTALCSCSRPGSWRRLGRPISGIGMCGLKSILLVQLSAAPCQGLGGRRVLGVEALSLLGTCLPSPCFSAPATALFWGWLCP